MRGAPVRRRSLASAAVVWMAAILWMAIFGWHVLAAPDPQTPQPSAPAASSDSRATIDKYCVTCHNQRLKTGNLALDAPELDRRRRARGRVGEGDSQGPGRHDAAGRTAAAGRRVA